MGHNFPFMTSMGPLDPLHGPPTKTICSRAVVPNRGCRGTQGCRQILNLLPFLVFLTTKGALNCHFSQSKGAAKFFSVLQGAVNQKRLKNTALEHYLFTYGNSDWQRHTIMDRDRTRHIYWVKYTYTMLEFTICCHNFLSRFFVTLFCHTGRQWNSEVVFGGLRRYLRSIAVHHQPSLDFNNLHMLLQLFLKS